MDIIKINLGENDRSPYTYYIHMELSTVETISLIQYVETIISAYIPKQKQMNDFSLSPLSTNNHKSIFDSEKSPRHIIIAAFRNFVFHPSALF